MHRILFTLLGAAEIEISAQAVGNGQIRLKYPAKHFLVERFLKRLGRSQDGVSVRVFCFEVRNDLGILFVAQPGVMIDAAVTVHNRHHRLAACKRRRRRRTAVRVVRKYGHYCFRVRVHRSLDLLRSARRAPGLAPDLAGVTLSKDEMRSSVILTEVRGGGKPRREARKEMAQETEVKLRISDAKAFKCALKRLEARAVGRGSGRVREWNVIFDTPDGGLAKHGQLLRIRTET